ncbi:uncharacterized protein E5676_scaffold392G00410 [Cucumis melo var. makuwa]|uniref:Uncharacterized protein n=1 Tax=Cucumis melo var. makuwa TaxID=1194695 RepID=A0A5A7VNJ6_CUCMM|nr:uncharacterized protein E6C27_scaffold238G001240 [Cucumis melo var. makuwa]TYK21076.1 uncharacterized protein E5676_scaffold392G00410 [Cucumis melo var. makuwa]
MTEEETIIEFNVRVLDIANESDALGQKMSDSKFLNELFESLRTFELHLGDGVSRGKPGLSLTSIKEELAEEHKLSHNQDSLAGVTDEAGCKTQKSVTQIYWESTQQARSQLSSSA